MELILPLLKDIKQGGYALMQDSNLSMAMNLHWDKLVKGKAVLALPKYDQTEENDLFLETFPQIQVCHFAYGLNHIETRLRFFELNPNFYLGQFNKVHIGFEYPLSIRAELDYYVDPEDLAEVNYYSMLTSYREAGSTFVLNPKHQLAFPNAKVYTPELNLEYLATVMKNLPLGFVLGGGYLMPQRITDADYRVVRKYQDKPVIATNSDLACLPKNWNSLRLNKAEYYYALTMATHLIDFKNNPWSWLSAEARALRVDKSLPGRL